MPGRARLGMTLEPLAQVLGGGAVAAVALPGGVPYGLHSAWLPFEDLPLASEH